ncbi:MAG: S41 family peptidase [Candidatus Bipolaricaulota bacterium]
MRRSHIYKITLALVLIVSFLCTQPIAAKTISSEQAIEDAEYLWDKLETVHPNLYFETTKKEAESKFQGIVELLEAGESWSRVELYRLLAPFVALFQDGHTNLSINQEFLHYADNGGRIIPLMVSVNNGKLITAGNLSREDPSPGEELLSVNGKDAREIYNQITAVIGAKRQAFVEAKASRSFPIYLWALYGFSDSFEISYRTEDGEQKTVRLQGISVANYRERKDAKLGKYELNWDLSFPGNDVGLLTINTFAGNLESEFKKFTDNSFRKIEKQEVDHLIIDLRENGGGSTKLSDYLYRFVSEKPFRTFAEVRVKYSDPVLEKKKIFNPITWFKVKVLGDQIIVNKNEYKNPPRTKYRFDGELFLLTGRMTFSTAADFAALIKDLDAGTIVGEETGGLASTYGDIFQLNLPNSGLTVGISYKYFLRPAGFDDGQGVIPDIFLATNPVRRYQGEDVVLSHLLEKI